MKRIRPPRGRHASDYDAWPTNAPPLVGSTCEFNSGSKHYVWLEFNVSDAVPSSR